MSLLLLLLLLPLQALHRRDRGCHLFHVEAGTGWRHLATTLLLLLPPAAPVVAPVVEMVTMKLLVRPPFHPQHLKQPRHCL